MGEKEARLLASGCPVGKVTVIASAAKQSRRPHVGPPDCRVATLLAMTTAGGARRLET